MHPIIPDQQPPEGAPRRLRAVAGLPDQADGASRRAAAYEAGMIEGERATLERLGIPQGPPPSPARVRHLRAVSGGAS